MIQVPLDQPGDQILGLLQKAADDEVLLIRDGHPVGVLIAFADDDDWFDYQLENHPRLSARIEKARAEVKAGKTISFEDLKEKLGA
jgi:hypothetical protein